MSGGKKSLLLYNKDLAFLISLEERSPRSYNTHSYLSINLSVVRLEDGRIRSYYGDFENFVVTGNMSSDPTDGQFLDGTYGWVHHFKANSPIRLYDAEKMIKPLRIVRNGLTTWEKKLGEPSSFPSYAARIASVLSIDTYCKYDKNDDLKVYDTIEGILTLKTIISEWRERFK